MAIFVEHKESHEFFVLVSGGFAAFHNNQHGHSFTKVCLCDRAGNLGWLESSEVRVINIDGADIKEFNALGKFDEDTL